MQACGTIAVCIVPSAKRSYNDFQANGCITVWGRNVPKPLQKILTLSVSLSQSEVSGFGEGDAFITKKGMVYHTILLRKGTLLRFRALCEIGEGAAASLRLGMRIFPQTVMHPGSASRVRIY